MATQNIPESPPLTRTLFALALSTLGLVTAAQAAPVAKPDALTVAIAAADANLFDIYFNKCDPAAMAAIIMPNVEFYHDKGGVIASDANGMVADYEKGCTEKLKPDVWRSRSALDRTSLRVYAVPGFGAIEERAHRFFERQGEGREKLVGIARFVILWKLDGDVWKPARIFSYAHEAAKAR